MKKGAWANIPPKSNRSDPICFSPYLYRARNRVERFFNRIKQCRRVATRYDRLAANYLAFVQLASSGYGYVLMSPRPSSTMTFGVVRGCVADREVTSRMTRPWEPTT
jgi:hypothetical protein